jgi:hypothetical protein
VLRHDNEVDVVRHQAIAPHRQPVPFAVFEERVEVNVAVAPVEKNIAAIIATLRHMMRHTDRHNPGLSGHR